MSYRFPSSGKATTKGTPMPLKYLNNTRRFITRALRMVALPCLIVAVVAMSAESRPTRSTNPSASKPVTVEQIRTAVRLATHQSPDAPRPLSVKLASATSRMAGPIGTTIYPVGMNRSFPGLNSVTIQFSNYRTQQVKRFLDEHGSLTAVLAGGAATAFCALLAVPLVVVATPVVAAVVAAILGPTCGTFILANWGQIDDAMRHVKLQRKPTSYRRAQCLQFNVYNLWNMGFITTFDHARCVR